jgi:hypothetical protein
MATEYQYTTHRTTVNAQKVSSVEAAIEEYAGEGWRLVETLDAEGTTVGLVFERPREA